MENIRKAPILFSILIFSTIFLINRLPLSDGLLYYGLEQFYADNVENIFLYSLIVVVIFWLIKRLQIPFSLYRRLDMSMIYFLPLLLYVFVFSGGFSDFRSFDFSALNSAKLLVYGAETFTSAFLEEVLFRGLILGLLLHKYTFSKHGIFKSVLLSGLIFGFLHIINVWTMADQMTMQSVFNQMYAAACLGVLYSAVYLKTRNILMLAILHFLTNFFAGIGELGPISDIVATSSGNKTSIEIFLSAIATLVIFGLPLLMGLFILDKIEIEEAEQLAVPNDKDMAIA
jgi:uncharacterized protein